MAIVRDEVGGVVVLRPAERLDVSMASGMREALEEVFECAGRRVLVDMGRVTYISSIGLSSLLRGAQLAQAQGGRIVLAGLSRTVREAFEISNLDSVLTVYPTVELALASFEFAAPRRASGTKKLETGLTLPEEILLLALRDDGGRFIELPRHALDFALAGAVLVDLCLKERIDSDLENVTVADARPLQDSILDPALRAIASAREPRGAEHWVGVLASEGAEIQRRVVDRLVERRVLQRKDSLLYWVLGGRRYPVLEDQGQREIKERVLGILRNGEIPGPREVAIIALAEACAVFDALLDMDEMLDVRSRILEVSRMDLVAQAIQRTLVAAQSSGNWKAAPRGIYQRSVDVAP